MIVCQNHIQKKVLKAATAKAAMLEIRATPLEDPERHCLIRVNCGKLDVVAAVVFMV